MKIYHCFLAASLLCFVSAIAGCTDNESATRILTQQGYTNINITGYQYFGCSNDDSIHTGFTAKTVTGASVSGVVCSGLMKSSTIRLD